MRLYVSRRCLAVCSRRFLVAALAVGLLVVTIFTSVAAATERGDSACDRDALKRLNKNDVLSKKFMQDHICLIRKTLPKDLDAFCRDFRPKQPIYQVMLLKNEDIKRLRNDLKGHQEDFHNDRKKFRPLRTGESSVHYTTDNPYTFVYCELTKTWQGKQQSNKYLQYIPQGTAEGVYQIYHGCRPVKDYPGFSQSGWC